MEVYSKSVHEAPECRKSLQSTLRPRSKCRERFGIAHPNHCGSAVESLLCFPLLMSVYGPRLSHLTIAMPFLHHPEMVSSGASVTSTAQSWLNVVGARMSNVRISCPTLGLVTLEGSR